VTWRRGSVALMTMAAAVLALATWSAAPSAAQDLMCGDHEVTVNLGAGESPTDGRDVILGTAAADTIDALGGNDVVCGLGGNDRIDGGPGDDLIYSGGGHDQIYGSGGNDTLYGQYGADTISGGPGEDFLGGGRGYDTLYGGDGNDNLSGAGGHDFLSGGPGNDNLYGRPGDDTMYGDAGDDELYGSSGDDKLYGGLGNDRVQGQSGADHLDGGEGDDLMYGKADNDVLLGGAGVDEMYAGDGDDEMRGGADNDWLHAGKGDDTINGGSGRDLCFAGPGADTVTDCEPDQTDSTIVTSGALTTLSDCSALLDHLQTEAAARVGPYGLGHGGGPIDIGIVDDVFLDDAVSEALPVAAAPASDAAERVAFSETTVQELGIDEPDIIKTNGERILTISNNELIVIDVRANEARVAGRIQIADSGWMRDMLVVDDRVFVFGDGWQDIPVPVPPLPVEPGGTEPADAPAIAISLPRYGQPQAVIFEFDLSDESRPTLTGELEVEGRYLSARLVDDIARVAIQSNPNQLPFLYPANGRGEEAATAANRQVILDSTLEDWLPTYSLDRYGSEISSGLLTPCERAHIPTDFAGFGSLSLLSLDMNAPIGNGQASTVMASGETVYASNNAFYVATNNWMNPAWAADELVRQSDQYTTSIHAFDIANPIATYEASGGVSGHLLNQFALSEHNGYLRVATTDGAPWSDETESFVHVLQPQADALTLVGSVGEMGRGERIRSVRFADDIAYIVTFRQTDPFYTVDLSNPVAPVVRGELKITGYSGQLFPIGDSLVIGIGQEATEEGRTLGAKLTVFDVSDLDNPVDLDNWVLPDSFTNAERDHRAFLWWGPENLAVVPVSSWATEFWGAVAFEVTRESGIVELGRIEHSSEDYGASAITRSMVISDELWTLSNDALQSNGLSGLATTQQLDLN